MNILEKIVNNKNYKLCLRKDVEYVDKEDARKYKNDEFKINCIYNKNGKKIEQIIEESFRGYYRLKVNT